MKGISTGLMIMMCCMAAWGTSLKLFRKPPVSRISFVEHSVASGDSIPPDTIIPPKYDFLNDDSLIAHYVIEDTSKYTYEMIREDLRFLQEKYPAFVHPVTVGKSEFGLD